MLTESKIIELTSLFSEDAPELAEVANNPKVALYLRDSFPQPYTVEHAREFIKLMNEGNIQSVFAVRYYGEMAGIAGAHLLTDVQKKTAEIGFWFGEKFWNRGIATEVCRQITTFAFTYFDIIKVQAEVASPNTASARVLEKNGFKLEGTLRKSFHKNDQDWDLLVYGLLKEELEERQLHLI